MSEPLVENWSEVGRMLGEMKNAKLRVDLKILQAASPSMQWSLVWRDATGKLKDAVITYGQTATQATERGYALWIKKNQEENPA